jgi:hypothetical protein
MSLPSWTRFRSGLRWGGVLALVRVRVCVRVLILILVLD